MNHCTIEFIEKLSEDVEKKMDRDFIEYESHHGIDVNFKRFSVVLRDKAGHPLGALNAFTAYAEIYVDDLWVDKSHRGKGYGRKLLEALEKHFKGKGFNNINLVTNAFQAPEFYKKCGFTQEFVRENKQNPQFNKIFFVKFFEEELQTQGLLKEEQTLKKQ